MTLAERILQCLSEDGQIAAQLAAYKGKPAVFYRTAPEDGSPGWDSQEHYPRIAFQVDLQVSQERKDAGTVRVSLLCKETGTSPEEIEPLIRACMGALIIQTDQNPPYCISWAKTGDLVKPEGSSAGIIGLEMNFDIFSCPEQETTDPDPVTALNWYIKRKIPQAFVLGVDHLEHVRKAQAQSPVFYSRLESMEKGQVTNTVVWAEGKVAILVLCPQEDERLKWSMELAKALAFEEEITMQDHSPMQVKALQLNNKADYLKEGQILVTGRYGLLRYRNQPHMITGIHMDLG